MVAIARKRKAERDKALNAIACTFPDSFAPNPGGQRRFFERVPLAEVVSLPERWIYLRGGINSGKSTAGAAFACSRAMTDPQAKGLITANTYGQLESATLVSLAKFCMLHGIPLEPMQGEAEETAKSIAARRFCRIFGAPVLVLSAEAFTGTTARAKDSGRGTQVRWIWADEFSYADKSAFSTINGRLGRGDGSMKGLGVVTSSINKNDPYNWTYEVFDSPERDEAQVRMFVSFNCPTLENIHADDDFIEAQMGGLTKELAQIELEGEYATSGSDRVHHTFDRALNNTDEDIEPDDVLHIGMDFNVGKMAAVTHVLRDELPRAVDEMINLFDTPAMIAEIQRRYEGHEIIVYPDASGKGRRSVDASQSDLKLLKAAGFKVVVNASNPAPKDRINAMNAMFLNAAGDRRYLVNVKKCPTYTRCLERQLVVNGEPDKKGGFDHANEASGYFIVKLFPIGREQRRANAESLRRDR